MSKKQTKTNHSQQNEPITSGSKGFKRNQHQTADKTREQELKITDKKVIDAIINLKLGEERERERCKEKINELLVFFESDMWYASNNEWKKEKDMLRYLDVHFDVLFDDINEKEQKIKGDEK